MIVKYVAVDGTTFATEKECHDYESKFSKNVTEKFEKLPMTVRECIGEYEYFGGFSVDEDVYAVKIQSELALHTVNDWLRLNCCTSPTELLNETAIGTIQLISVLDGSAALYGTPDDLKRAYCDAVDSLVYNLSW